VFLKREKNATFLNLFFLAERELVGVGDDGERAIRAMGRDGRQ
jgi:hypothetical protein